MQLHIKLAANNLKFPENACKFPENMFKFTKIADKSKNHQYYDHAMQCTGMIHRVQPSCIAWDTVPQSISEMGRRLADFASGFEFTPDVYPHVLLLNNAKSPTPAFVA